MSGCDKKISTLVYSMSFDRYETPDLEEDQIRYVPTLSKRKKSVTRVLNEIIREKPDCTNTVYALLTYSTQKWARDTRNEIGLNPEKSLMIEDSFKEAAVTMGELYRKSGIPPRIEDTRIIRISESDEILDCIEDGLSWLEKTPVIGYSLAKAIRAVHLMDDAGSDISAYLFKEYYKPAILYLNEQVGPDIDRVVTELTSCQWLYDGNRNSTAYHNTMLLIKIYPFLIHRFVRRYRNGGISDLGIQKDTDGLFLLKILEDAVNGVRRYEGGGERLYQILRLMLLAQPDAVIKKELDLTTSALYEQKARAVNMLSFLLWGYSTVEILEGIVFAPLTKKDLRKII